MKQRDSVPIRRLCYGPRAAEEDLAMKLDVMRGAPNVVRFPLERRGRPTLETLRALAHAGHEALLAGDLFGFKVEADLRDQVCRDVLEEAHAVAPDDGEARILLLGRMLQPLLAQGVAACLAALEEAELAEAARHRLDGVGKRTWLAEELRERRDRAATVAMARCVDAYRAVETAEGVARAIDLERADAEWTPRDWEAEAAEFDRLFLGEAA